MELKLLLTDTTGLKIPNSAITTKEFLIVPKDYVTKGGDSDRDGLLMERTLKDGATVTEFVPATLFYATEKYYYIDSGEIQQGDVAVRPDSNERYTLREQKSWMVSTISTRAMRYLNAL